MIDQRTAIAPTAIPISVHDAFVRMARRADNLPSWCDQGEPVARAIQAALGIRLVPELIDREDHVAAALRLLIPALEELVDRDFEYADRRFRHRPRCVITVDDIAAAELVVASASKVLIRAVIFKERWRATIGDKFLTDWTIIKRVMFNRQSFRDFARELGLDERAIRTRFHDAIEAIAANVGPVRWPKSLSPHRLPYNRGRCGTPPIWHPRIHIHVDRPGFQTREQVLAAELTLAAEWLAAGGIVQKLPPGLASGYDQHQTAGLDRYKRRQTYGRTYALAGKLCAAYGADGELLWVVSSRPQPAWDDVTGVARYHDADLDVASKWGKGHVDFEKKYRRGMQWLDPWQSRSTQRFAIKFYNAGEDGLLPDKLNGAEIRGRPNRDCTGPDWEYQGIFVTMREPPRQREAYAPGWDEGPIPKRPPVSGVESIDVRNDTLDLLVRWSPPSSYFNDGMNNPLFSEI